MADQDPVVDDQDAQDDALILQALDPQSQLDFSRELDPGEKADDAVDFGDLSDDDLADEEEPNQKTDIDATIDDLIEIEPQQDTEIDAAIGDGGDEFSDLFGDEGLRQPHDSSQPTGGPHPDRYSQESSPISANDAILAPTGTFRQEVQGSTPPDVGDTLVLNNVQHQSMSHISKDQQMQQDLFALSRAGDRPSESLPEPPENHEELLAALWPKFQRDTVPQFMQLLPPKKAQYAHKVLLKQPRAIYPSKLTLDIDMDQEKAFRSSIWSTSEVDGDYGSTSNVRINLQSRPDDSLESDEGGFSETDHEIEGTSWEDLQLACEDWDISSQSDTTVEGSHLPPNMTHRASHYHPARETGLANSCSTPKFGFYLDSAFNRYSPEINTAHIAKKIRLDLNDSRLLLGEAHSAQRNSTANHLFLNEARHFGSLKTKYNVSNDDAYDQLKENHQHKIRDVLGNPSIEHSLPALRLQWPFYKTSLEKQEARSFHRPRIRVIRHEQVSFTKPDFIKKKHIRGKDIQSLFSKCKDLALDDNSSVLLLEYSEEHPMMLSNLGMGNKVINYYRKTSAEDTSRPKLDIGELRTLLPLDKSPFSLFGHVDAGQIVPAIYNGMYKAPIFRQVSKTTDFLIVKRSTGIEGTSWFLKNIDHVHVVGQELPSIDVPGPHSRKVTTASKNRLKMISYRLARKARTHRISVSEVTRHFIKTTDMQNRQKMKEFMLFDKENKEWRMRQGESIPDEETIRTMIKPEDICLLESMQAGQQHLRDAGFSKEDDEASEGDEVKEGQSVEQQLAPWHTSRNFLNATQGKAMLQLHGEGDPTRRGEGFSLIKTSMKGGFRAVGESVTERMDNKKMKDSGGHSYNVAKQQQSYEESIRRIWEAQRQSLSSTLELSDFDTENEEAGMYEAQDGTSSHQNASSSFTMKNSLDDDTASQSTRASSNMQNGRILEISRVLRDRYGNEETIKEIVRNPRVIRQYLKRKRNQSAENEDLLEIRPGMDKDENKRKELRLKKELERLNRNKERRIARDKQRGVFTDGAADSESMADSPGGTNATRAIGTQRKCANCGQVGHIKTNKKLCPMLNGTMKPEENFSSSAFSMGAPQV